MQVQERWTQQADVEVGVDGKILPVVVNKQLETGCAYSRPSRKVDGVKAGGVY